MIDPLPRVIPSGERARTDRRDHPMRRVTEQVAEDPQRWTPSQADEVRQYFDTLAADWNGRFVDDPLRSAPLADALDRGGIVRFGRVLDLGSGTGLETSMLVGRFAAVVAVDLSLAMLAQAPTDPPRVQGDGARLPFADGTFDAVVLVNALLFGAEMARVLAPTATLVWVSSVGADTPIYLPSDEVAAALGGRWSGVESAAGDGTWVALRRSDDGA
jgi:SAM-dependent methyltransferase